MFCAAFGPLKKKLRSAPRVPSAYLRVVPLDVPFRLADRDQDRRRVFATFPIDGLADLRRPVRQGGTGTSEGVAQDLDQAEAVRADQKHGADAAQRPSGLLQPLQSREGRLVDDTVMCDRTIVIGGERAEVLHALIPPDEAFSRG